MTPRGYTLVRIQRWGILVRDFRASKSQHWSPASTPQRRVIPMLGNLPSTEHRHRLIAGVLLFTMAKPRDEMVIAIFVTAVGVSIAIYEGLREFLSTRPEGSDLALAGTLAIEAGILVTLVSVLYSFTFDPLVVGMAAGIPTIILLLYLFSHALIVRLAGVAKVTPEQPQRS